MSSSGKGFDISQQEAADLLHKLITESAKVRIALWSPTAGAVATVTGVIKSAEDGQFMVQEGDAIGVPTIGFKPRNAIGFKYGDDRVLPASAPDKTLLFSSALTFIFPDGTLVSVFEIRGSV
jgi:hypothetical protein